MLSYLDRRQFLGTAAALAAAPLGLLGFAKPRSAGGPSSRSGGPLSSLSLGNAWLNTQPLTAASLAGKVVLIDFWTYTCINWLRTFPYVRAWAEKYKDKGLVVIGVHTPEFSFEHDLGNVRQAAKERNVGYPIVLDNDYAIWNAFNNQYWPALYLIDAKGRIQYHQFGEGQYEQSEKTIQRLLTEAGATGLAGTSATGSAGASATGSAGAPATSLAPAPASFDRRSAELAADWSNLQSGENYVGYERTQNFSSPGGAVLDKPNIYAAPPVLERNQWALSGDWTMQKDGVVSNKPGARIAYGFHARDLHCVMGPAATHPPVTGPAAPSKSIRFRVLIDGQQTRQIHGVDVDDQGNGLITEPKMYQLIRQPKPITDRRFEIEFLDPGVKAYSFTFG
jgi:thiol-disulfide isomerase/thioredoxin